MTKTNSGYRRQKRNLLEHYWVTCTITRRLESLVGRILKSQVRLAADRARTLC